MTTDRCPHHQTSYKSTGRSLSNTVRNAISRNNLILMAGVAIALFTSSAGSSPVDPNTLEQALGSYTNHPGYVLHGGDVLSAAKRMGEGSGFVRFGKRAMVPPNFELGHPNPDELQRASLDQDQFDRALRSESGFVRFGKRKIPGGVIGKRKVPGGILRGKRTNDQADEPFEVSKRASSGFVRFGKRMPGSDMRFGKRDNSDGGGMKVGNSYSDCVAKTVAMAVDRTDLLNLLVANGCIRRRFAPLQENYVQVRLE